MAREMVSTDNRPVSQPLDGGEATRARRLFRPRADIYETVDKIVVVAEMPGVAPENVDVTLERRMLTIRGHAPEDTHEGYRQIYAEYQAGDYERSFTISEDIDQDRIKATQQDGVLTLELPKAEKAKARKIEVKSA